MSLSSREERLLMAIGASVGSSQPKLTTMMAMFARLTAGEPMPSLEQFPTRAGRLAALAGWLRRLARRASSALRWLCAGIAETARHAASLRPRKPHQPASGHPDPYLP